MKTPNKTIALYKGKVIIDFYEGRHQYFANGEKVKLSVTGVTGIIDKSGPLVYWAVNLAKEHLLNNLDSGITEEVIVEACKQHQLKKQEAADIGHMAHDWAYNHAIGTEQPMPEDPRVLNGVIAFLKWEDENKIKTLGAEQIVYSKKHGYVGIFDRLATIRRKRVLIDYKTSKGVYPEYRLQLAAYRNAWEEETGEKIDQNLILHFDKDTGDFRVIECDEYEKDLKAFLACLEAKKRMSELEEWKKLINAK